LAAPADITVLYFAWLRERIGVGEERLTPPPEVDRVDRRSARGAGYAAAFARRQVIRCAVNQSFAAPDAPIRGGDEVAFFPPLTGG
jgi:molybdopterin synthase sulfur carrier subunit